MRMDGKVAVITGGASGIGRSTVERFVETGGRVVIADVQDDLGQALAFDLGEAAVYAHCNVMEESDIENAVSIATGKWDRLDLMFNNAGVVGDVASIDEIDAADWDQMMALLLRSAMLGTKHAARVMKTAGSGAIVNNASVAALVPGNPPIAYSVAKAGVVQLTKHVAIDLAPFGIRVNCVCPGLIATPIIGHALGLDGPASHRAVDTISKYATKMQPLARGGTARDVANAVLYLADDEAAAFITGVILPVDGALSAGRPGVMTTGWEPIVQAVMEAENSAH